MPLDNSGRWIPEDDTVATRLTDITSKNSPFMQQARTGAQQVSEKRGLQNSSIAASAGESAALNAALPVAQQDASQTFQKNFAEQGLGHQMQLGEQQQGFDMAKLQQDLATRRELLNIQ